MKSNSRLSFIALLVLAGCSSQSDPPHTTTQAPAPTEENRQVMERVLPRAADLGVDWEVDGESQYFTEPTPALSPQLIELEDCLGGRKSIEGEKVEMLSSAPLFSDPSQNDRDFAVRTYLHNRQTSKDADAYIARSKSDSARACYRDFTQRYWNEQDDSVDVLVEVTPVAGFVVPENGYAFRTVTNFDAYGSKRVEYEDHLALSKGPLWMTIDIKSYNDPPPLSLETTLIELFQNRMDEAVRSPNFANK